MIWNPFLPARADRKTKQQESHEDLQAARERFGKVLDEGFHFRFRPPPAKAKDEDDFDDE